MVKLEKLVAPALGLALALAPASLVQSKHEGGGFVKTELSPDQIRTVCNEVIYKNKNDTYAVFATDDAPTYDPLLIDTLFSCRKFGSNAHRAYCGETRFKNIEPRIGEIPRDAITEGLDHRFNATLRANIPEERDTGYLRVGLILTSPEFEEQLEPLFPFLPSGTYTENYHKIDWWSTKAGIFYRIQLPNSEETLGMLVHILG